MSLLGPRQAPLVCPQCKIMLPLNQTVCSQCGFNSASLQADALPGNAQVSLSHGTQFRGPRIAPLNNGSQFRGPRTPGLLSGTSLGRSQTPGLLSSTQLGSSQTPELLSGTPLGGPRTPGLLSGTPLMNPQTPAILNSVHVKTVQTPAILNRVRMETMQTPAILNSVHVEIPQTPRLSNSVQIQPPQGLSSNGVQERSPQTPSVPRKRQERSHGQKRATLIYFCSVLLVIIISSFAGLNAAGISLTTLVSHNAKNTVITYRVPKVAPLFEDSFVNDASGWNLQSSPGNYGVTVGNGTLTIALNKPQLLWEVLPGTISYGNFTLVVNAVLATGDQNNGYGVYIRGAASPNSDFSTYYRFELYGDASYAIFKGVVDQSGKSTDTKIVNYTLNSAIQKQGTSNQIMIFARGSYLAFIVNGQLLKSFTDADYQAGSIGLFASNLPEAKPGIQVQFSQMALYPMQLSLPS